MGQEIPHPQPLYLKKKMFMQIIKGFIAYRIKAESAAFQRNHYQQLSVCVLRVCVMHKYQKKTFSFQANWLTVYILLSILFG